MKKYWLAKYCLVLAALLFTVNGVFALSINASVSQDYDLGFESVIKRKFGDIFKISKIFEKNDDLFYQKRYCPIYMLSMKDIYSMVPTVTSNLEKRLVPNTYNLSFKQEKNIPQSNISLINSNVQSGLKKIETQNTAISSEHREYQELLAQNPERIEILYKYAQFLYTKRSYNDAISVLNKIIQKDDSFVLASYTLGNIYFDMGEYKNAIKANLAVIAKNPYCSDAYFNIASSLEKLQKFSLAISYYQKCLALNASDTQAQNAVKRLEQLTFNQEKNSEEFN